MKTYHHIKEVWTKVFMGKTAADKKGDSIIFTLMELVAVSRYCDKSPIIKI